MRGGCVLHAIERYCHRLCWIVDMCVEYVLYCLELQEEEIDGLMYAPWCYEAAFFSQFTTHHHPAPMTQYSPKIIYINI